MKFIHAALLASLATFANGATVNPPSRRGCAEAARFGVVTTSPSSVAPGDSLTINADFNCAINWFGIIPQYTDYYLEVVTNNNGHEPPILLARRTLLPGATNDSFTVEIPYAYYFANTTYTGVLDTTYPVSGTNGTPYSVVGGVYFNVNLVNVTSS
ncbi:hypothetical protein F5I97DRAFT_1929193 [Phlebopus sp. FC_14]|nr:hypothetical protein F5I97DRAFT_1929193 [Phlebopus sp. FC_14]